MEVDDITIRERHQIFSMMTSGRISAPAVALTDVRI